MPEPTTPATVPDPPAQAAPPAAAPAAAVFAIGLAFCGGLAAAVQSAVNAELGDRVGSPLSAAMVSNVVGALLLLGIFVAAPATRRGLMRILRNPQPWWVYLGGVFGAAFLFTGAFTVPLIGVALFTVGQVCGQTGGGLLADRAGLGPGGRVGITLPRVLGTVLAVVAVLIGQIGRGFDDGAAWWLLPLVALVGVGLAGQGAFNARLTVLAGNPFSTGMVNCVVGTAAILVVLAPLSLAGSIPWNGLPTEPWLYVGGLMGPFVVASVIVSINAVGVLRSGLGVLAGQLSGALALDVVRTGAAPSAWVVAGVLLTAVAVIVSGRTRGRVREAAEPA